MISTTASEYVTSHYSNDIAEYLLAADGFRVDAEPGRERLGAEWQAIFAELVEAGHMRRSGTGRYWWVSEQDSAPGRPEIGGVVNVRLGDLLPGVDAWAAKRSVTRARAIRAMIAWYLRATAQDGRPNIYSVSRSHQYVRADAVDAIDGMCRQIVSAAQGALEDVAVGRHAGEAATAQDGAITVSRAVEDAVGRARDAAITAVERATEAAQADADHLLDGASFASDRALSGQSGHLESDD